MKKAILLLLCVMIVLSAAVGLRTTAAAETTDETQPVTDATEPEDDVVEPAIHVPQIRVVTADSNGTVLQKADGYVDASIEITDVDGSVIAEDVSFKVRGNGTALPSILKKAYTFKFAKKRDVLGMGKGKKWVLLANAMDVTLLRNYVAFDFAQTMDLRYTSEQKMVELWVDDSFRGLYVLTEPVQEGKDRVNIDIESNGGMKDFLLELEAGRTEEGVSYIKNDGIRFAISEPEEPNAEQYKYINTTVANVLSVIKSGREDAIREVVDVDSFAKYYILNEYVKTVDFDYSSVFFYYQDGKLCAGPPWDYDHSMGSGADAKAQNYQKAAPTDGVFAGDVHFYRYLCSYDWFMDEVREIYLKNRDYIRNISEDGGLIDTLAATYSAEIDRNFSDAGWSITRVWSPYQRQPLPTYQENLDYMKDWCTARFLWLDDYLLAEKEPDDVDYYIGDADGDGSVNILDATAIQRVLAVLPTESYNEIAADADCDGRITILDATAIQRHLADLETSAPVGQPVKK